MPFEKRFSVPQPTEQALPEPIILKRRWLEVRDELISAWEKYRFLRDVTTDRSMVMNSEMKNRKIMMKNFIQSKTISLYLALEIKLKSKEKKNFELLSRAISSSGPSQLDLDYLKDCFMALNRVLNRIGLFKIEKRVYSPDTEILDTGEDY